MFFARNIKLNDRPLIARPGRGGRGGSFACCVAFLLTLASTPALSNPDLPTGATVAAGQVTFSPKESSLDVHQGSHKAIVNWQSFNIGKDASVNIHQPGADAALLNRVLSSDPSRILGSLNANGQVFLINPSGVIFGQGARVDVGGLVASSLNISDKDFLSGSYTFSGNTGSILNQGALQGGFIALISPEIKNEGEIRASLSAIALASGDQAVLTFEGSDLIGLKVTDATVKSLIENKGVLIAPHGAVLLKASAAQSLVDSLIQSAGGAGGLVLKNGTVQLVRSEGTMTSSDIRIDAGPRGGVSISGTLDASAHAGGTITVTGQEVTAAAGASLNTSGPHGGGEIRFGGDWQGKGNTPQSRYATVEKGARLEASATESGNGGTIVVWSDITDPQSQTTVKGELIARGGIKKGNGGKIETSGYAIDTEGAIVRANARSEGGKGGLWFIDPEDAVITQGVADDYADTLNSGTSVTNEVSGDMTWQSGVALEKTDGGDAELALRTRDAGDITFESGASIKSTSGALDVRVDADGEIHMGSGVAIDTNGGGVSMVAHGNTLTPAVTEIETEIGAEADTDIVSVEPTEESSEQASTDVSESAETAESTDISESTKTVVQTSETESSESTADTVVDTTVDTTDTLVSAISAGTGTIRFTGDNDAGLTITEAIKITAATVDIDSTLTVESENTAQGGSISVIAQDSLTLGSNALVTANSDAGEGGEIILTATDISLESGATVEATGATGGGDILIGGDWQGGANEEHRVFDDPNAIPEATTVTIGSDVTVDASATQNGNGGTIVVWSDVSNTDSVTTVAGTLNAKGGAEGGNGGMIETSGYVVNLEGSTISTLAADGSAGMWLLDPTSLFVGASSDGTTSNDSRTILSLAQLNTNLDANNVTLQATQDVVLGGDFSFDGSTGNADRTLIFDAPLTVLLGSISVANTETEKLNVEIGTTTSQNLAVMSADRTIETNNGDVTIRGNIGGGQGLTIDAGTGAIALGSATGGLTGNYWDGTSTETTETLAANTTIITYTAGGVGDAIVLDFANGTLTNNGSPLSYSGVMPKNLSTAGSGVFLDLNAKNNTKITYYYSGGSTEVDESSQGFTIPANTTVTKITYTSGNNSAVNVKATSSITKTTTTYTEQSVSNAALTSLTLSGTGTNTLNGNITTTGAIDLGTSRSTTLAADTTLTTTNSKVTLGSVNGAQALSVSNGSGGTTLGVIGGSTALSSVTLSGTGTNTLNGDIDATGNVDLMGASRSRQSGTPAFSVGGTLTCDTAGTCVNSGGGGGGGGGGSDAEEEATPAVSATSNDSGTGGKGSSAGGKSGVDTLGDGRGASCERGNASFCDRKTKEKVAKDAVAVTAQISASVVATVSTQSTSSDTENNSRAGGQSQGGSSGPISGGDSTLGGLSGGSVSSVNSSPSQNSSAGSAGAGGTPSTGGSGGEGSGGSAGGANAGNTGSSGGNGSTSNGNQGVDSGDGNGTEAGAGGSDLNNNAISGSAGNQGNDKPVGNAGGNSGSKQRQGENPTDPNDPNTPSGPDDPNPPSDPNDSTSPTDSPDPDDPNAPSDSAATDGNESTETASGGEQENAAVEEDNAEGTEDQAARLARTTENGEIQVKLPPEFDSQGGETFVYTLPSDTFVHTNSEGRITITVALINGETVTDLPADMTFIGATGQVTGRLPDKAGGILGLRFIARDQWGAEAITDVNLRIPGN